MQSHLNCRILFIKSKRFSKCGLLKQKEARIAHVHVQGVRDPIIQWEVLKAYLCFLPSLNFPELHNMNKKSKCKQLFFIINFTRISEYQIHRGDTQRRIRRRCLQRDALHIYSWLIRTPSICFNVYKELSVQISSKN